MDLKWKYLFSFNAKQSFVLDFHKIVRIYSLRLLFRTMATNDPMAKCFPSCWLGFSNAHLCLVLRPLFSRSVNHPLLWPQPTQGPTAWCEVAIFHKTPIGPTRKKIHPQQWQLKTSRVASTVQCSGNGAAFGPLDDWGHSRDIVKLLFFIGSWAFCRKCLFLKEVKRILEFSWNLGCAYNSSILNL